MKNLNTGRFWDKKLLTEKFLLKSPIYIKKNILISNYLKKFKGNLLDIGVGYGTLENILSKKGSKLKFYGIDISKIAIDKIRDNVKGTFVIADVRKIPFKDNLFDFVVEMDLLEHFQKRELSKTLSEVRRVLRKEGDFIISVPLNETDKDGRLNRHLITFDQSSIRNLLERNGFKIVSTKLLFAFSNSFYLKTAIAKVTGIRKPNLIIIFSKK